MQFGGDGNVVQSSVNASEHYMLPLRDWEHEASDSPVSVKERLVECVTFWAKVIQAPAYIMEVIRSGYVLPFCAEPP